MPAPTDAVILLLLIVMSLIEVIPIVIPSLILVLPAHRMSFLLRMAKLVDYNSLMTIITSFVLAEVTMKVGVRDYSYFN